MQLSPHFNTREFDSHDGVAVPRYAYDDLRRLCRRFLEPLREAYGPVTVISGYRTPAQNRRVGGAPRSMHMYERGRSGAAADVRAARGQPSDWARFLEELEPGGLGRYAGHVHVDSRVGHARW